MTEIGANKMQTNFTSSKSVKTWETILLAINLTGKAAYISQSNFSWTQYLNTKLDLKTWTSQFSNSKSLKIRETILLAISLTGSGAYISQSQFSSS